ncbi:MAG: YkuS family protein [Clostridia bacterium]|nr:YkuS family protein [Clostridia bacterium]
MKGIKVEVQNGLNEVMSLLESEGFDVFSYGKAGLDADVTIITGIDDAYEEIQPAEYHCNGNKRMLVIDATNKKSNEILNQIHRFYK